MSTFTTGRLEARGMTASSTDVRGLENFLLSSLHRTDRDTTTSATIRRTPSSAYTNQAKGHHSIHHKRYHHHNYYNTNNEDDDDDYHHTFSPPRPSTSRHTTTKSTTPPLLLRYLNPKEMKLDLNGNELPHAPASTTQHNGFINSSTKGMRPYRGAQSAGAARQSTKRQMAVQCGIKTIPFDGRRWKNEKNTGSSPSVSTGKGQIVFQGPQDGNHSRRGLRGSKVRPGVSTPRPASQARSKFDSLEPSFGYRETSIISSPSPRNLSISSLQHSQTSLNIPVADSEDGQESGGGYGWNESDQGLRLQKHLSAKSSTRSMRRVSEMVHHRLDPMYKINGSKVTLQDRYGVDGTDMQKLQEMTITREELLSDLRKMKFNHGSGSYANQMNGQKHRLLQQNIARLQQPGNPSIYPPTPTSDFATARTTTTTNNNNNHNNNDNSGDLNQPPQQQQQQPSQQSDDDILDIIDDDDGGDDDDDDQFGDNVNDNRIREDVAGEEANE